MGFEITLDLKDGLICKGLTISYIFKSLWNLPMKWVVEITEVDEPFSFVDNQKLDLYMLWYYIHKFKKTDTDKISLKNFLVKSLNHMP